MQHRFACRKVRRTRISLNPCINKCFTDLTELELSATMKTHFPDPADLLNFTLTITPDEGV